MKYPIGQRVVEAIYDKNEKNPFVAALPEMLTKQQLFAAIESRPCLLTGDLSVEQRLAAISEINNLYIPMDYMYAIYESLFRSVKSAYQTKGVHDQIRKINALYNGVDMPYATAPNCGSILGTPGVGKSSTAMRVLETLPQTIEHTEINGQMFFCKQVLYLRVETPPDASIKTLCYSIIAALNDATGANIKAIKSDSASALATQIKIACLNFHVGLIIADEIQNAISTARKNRQVKPLLKFLLEIMNDTGVSVVLVGTPEAEEFFLSQEHLKRRTRGLRLRPMKPDGTYYHFLAEIWPYQYSLEIALLSNQIAKKLYDLSGGVPAYIIKLFAETQAQCLLTGVGQINVKMLQKTADMLAIQVPKVFHGGTHISDFTISENTPEFSPASHGDTAVGSVACMYGNKRGRKPVQRDPSDLLVCAKAGISLEKLLKMDMLEEWGC